MKRAVFFLILTITLLPVVLVFYNSCGTPTKFTTVNGTILGNPATPVSNEILFAVCGVINRCNPQITLEQCQNGILPTGGFATPLNLPTSYSTFSSVVQGEQTGTLVGNSAEGSNCYDSVNVLSCSDPSVAGAYNSSLANPYVGAPNMLSVSSCGQAFSPGVNLEVPVEIVTQGLASNITSTAFSKTRTSLNTTDYDGAVTYTFEIAGNNTDTVSRSVSLVDSSGTAVATIAVPNLGNPSYDPPRYSATFSPTAGANNYRVQLDGTASAGQLSVYEGRIRIKQVGATQTKIYIPLMAAMIDQTLNADDATAPLDASTVTFYSQPDPGWYSLWRKNSSAFSQLAVNNPWTFEAVLSATGGTAYASIFDSNTGLQVSASEASTNGSTPTLVSSSFADGAANFITNDTMQVQIKESGGAATIYRAGLWVKLTNLTHAEVYFRVNQNVSEIAGVAAQTVTLYRALVNLSSFTSPTVYHELIGNVSAPGIACSESLFDSGVSDTGLTGTSISGSTLSVSSTTLTRQRTPALNLTSGDRYTSFVSGNPGPGPCDLVNSFIVIGF